MDNVPTCWWPMDGPPSPLSTDIDEIASYMRVAHRGAASRDRKGASTARQAT